MKELILKDIRVIANTSHRLITEQDSTMIFKWFSDNQMVKYLPFEKVANLDDTLALIRMLNEISPKRARSYIVSEGQEDIDFLTLRRSNRFSLCIATSLLDRKYWGTSKALEVLKDYLKHFIRYKETYRIWAICHPDNKYSAKLMEKAGMIQSWKY